MTSFSPPTLFLVSLPNAQSYKAKEARGEVPARSIELVQGSIFDHDWSDGDVVFAHSTCFDGGESAPHSTVSRRLPHALL